MQDKRKRRFSWSSALGWLIFILVIGGGPLFNLLRQALSGVVALPANLVPYMIAGLVALSVVVSVVRSIAQATTQRGDSRLPTGAPARPNAPMPPFGGPRGAARLPTPAQPPAAYRPGETRPPAVPRFDPIITPTLVVVGLIGLVLLGVLTLVVLGQAIP